MLMTYGNRVSSKVNGKVLFSDYDLDTAPTRRIRKLYGGTEISIPTKVPRVLQLDVLMGSLLDSVV